MKNKEGRKEGIIREAEDGKGKRLRSQGSELARSLRSPSPQKIKEKDGKKGKASKSRRRTE